MICSAGPCRNSGDYRIDHLRKYTEQKEISDKGCSGKTGPGEFIRKKLCRTLCAVLAAVLLGLLIGGAATHMKAPKKPHKRYVLATVNVGGTGVDLTMDGVPGNFCFEPWHHGRVEKFYYDTNTYGLYGREEKKIRKYAEVYLPYGYDPSGKYDIVYLMHGAGGSPERFFGSALHPLKCRYIIDNLIGTGQIRPTIFVGLTYYPKAGMKREEDWDAQYTKYYGNELILDVLPQLEAHYSTYAESTDPAGLKKAREHRTFAGYSMGSVTAYYRLCDSLDYFRYFLAMSGSLYWGPDAVMQTEMSDFGAEYIMDAVKKQGYGPDDFFLYSCVGEDDFARDVVNAQIRDEQHHPEFFRMWEMPETEAAEAAELLSAAAEGISFNTVFLVGDGETHHGNHGTDRYLYNALPLLSKLMAPDA